VIRYRFNINAKISVILAPYRGVSARLFSVHTLRRSCPLTHCTRFGASKMKILV